MRTSNGTFGPTKFLANPAFVMAWVADIDYDFWQNADDPLEYGARNQPFDHLPMRSNGLPYPLQQTIIDTSNNPGRYALRRGYHEAIGHVMWLRAPFWSLTGADRRQVENQEGLSRSHPSADVLRIQAFPRCLQTSEGESGKIQRSLRDLLFPKNGKEYSTVKGP